MTIIQTDSRLAFNSAIDLRGNLRNCRLWMKSFYCQAFSYLRSRNIKDRGCSWYYCACDEIRSREERLSICTTSPTGFQCIQLVHYCRNSYTNFKKSRRKTQETHKYTRNVILVFLVFLTLATPPQTVGGLASGRGARKPSSGLILYSVAR